MALSHCCSDHTATIHTSARLLSQADCVVSLTTVVASVSASLWMGSVAPPLGLVSVVAAGLYTAAELTVNSRSLPALYHNCAW